MTVNPRAPAPLRDAMQLAEDWRQQLQVVVDANVATDRGEFDAALVLKLRELIIADREARRPDARLRELLDEGARLVERFSSVMNVEPFEAWARRAREVVSNSVDEL